MNFESHKFPPTLDAVDSGANEKVDSPQQGGLAPRRVVAALIRRGGLLLICQRGPQQPMALKWEFPGGKIEPGETSEQALVRELDEELGIRATISHPVTQIRHTYRNGGVVALEFFLVETYQGELQNRIFNEIRWERVENLPKYDFLAADHGLVRDLAAGKLL